MAFAPANTLFDEILDFLTLTPTPQQIIDYQVSGHLQERLSELLEKNQWNTLSAEEQKELDEFLTIDRLMSRLKSRARKKLMEVGQVSLPQT